MKWKHEANNHNPQPNPTVPRMTGSVECHFITRMGRRALVNWGWLWRSTRTETIWCYCVTKSFRQQRISITASVMAVITSDCHLSVIPWAKSTRTGAHEMFSWCNCWTLTHSFVRMWNSGNHRNDKSHDSTNGQGRLLNLLVMLQWRGWIPQSPETSFGSVPQVAKGGTTGLPTTSTIETVTNLQQTNVTESQLFNITNDTTISPLTLVTSSLVSWSQSHTNNLEIQQGASSSNQDSNLDGHHDNNILPTILQQDDEGVHHGRTTTRGANTHLTAGPEDEGLMVATSTMSKGTSELIDDVR